MLDLDALDFTKGGGLVTIVTQDATTGVVLMVAHADREALAMTMQTGEMHYRSRTRGLWHKGGSSGNVQRVVSLAADCDADAVLARVHPAGPACHTNAVSCFAGPTAPVPVSDELSALDATIAARATASAETTSGYTRKLLTDRNLRLKKLGEEAAELVLACADDDAERIVSEGADLVYHTLVALRAHGIGLDALRGELQRRATR